MYKLKTIKCETSDFHDHIYRMENILAHHILIEMDVAENYNCKTVEKTESACWN